MDGRAPEEQGEGGHGGFHWTEVRLARSVGVQAAGRCGARAAARRSLDVDEEVTLENVLALLVFLRRLVRIIL